MAKAKGPTKHQRIPDREPKQVSTYDKCKALWERRTAERKAQFAEAKRKGKPDRKDNWKTGWVTADPIKSAAGGGDWLVDQPELPLDPGRFLATLRSLGYHLQDQRYHDLRHELINSDLIDGKTGKRSRFRTTLANTETRFMCKMIEESIAAGFTEREAIAEAVVELELDAANFDSAHKRVKRLFDEYRKAVGHDPT